MKWIRYTIEGKEKCVNCDHITRLWHHNVFSAHFSHHINIRLVGESEDRVLFYTNTQKQAEDVLDQIMKFITQMPEKHITRIEEVMNQSDWESAAISYDEDSLKLASATGRALEVL